MRWAEVRVPGPDEETRAVKQFHLLTALFSQAVGATGSR